MTNIPQKVSLDLNFINRDLKKQYVGLTETKLSSQPQNCLYAYTLVSGTEMFDWHLYILVPL